MAPTPLWMWLTPALIALFLYGIGQGLVKKYISDVPPARFCLYFVAAKAIVNIGYFLSQEHPPVFGTESMRSLPIGILAYILDGTGWILYFKSIVLGPITIVGTLSAAYPATTVLFARIFLGEMLQPIQYAGVVLVISGCIGLSYSPSDDGARITDKRWMLYAGSALIIWGAAQTLVKYAYILEANEANMSLCNTLGGMLTLGVYGWLFGRAKDAGVGGTQKGEWAKSAVPMGMMAGGDLGVLVASKYGQISIVTPLTAAYPVVTLWFAALALKERIAPHQWLCVALIIAGMLISSMQWS